MTSLIPDNFAPDEGKLKLLDAWGSVNAPKGDQLMSNWFTTRADVIAEFIDYWSNRARDNKKKDWQLTYCNYIKRIAWPNELRTFEQSRHYRTDSGSTGFKRVNEAYDQLMAEKPVKQRIHKLPERPEAPPGPTDPLEALRMAKQALR